ncbi:MAG: hypothetical protein JOY79_01025, partial [Acidobacteriaceae bacterium]|nr:hypothetical protein [Acidobacteriaceae bacterium]
MWLEKIRHGVLGVRTELGVRYLRPRWYERILLIWTFRNFQVLPEQVLRPREREMISNLILRNGYVWSGNTDCCIGTVERHSPVAPKKSPESAPAPGG